MPTLCSRKLLMRISNLFCNKEFEKVIVIAVVREDRGKAYNSFLIFLMSQIYVTNYEESIG